MFKKFAALAAAAALSLGVMTGCGASGTTADSTGYSAENPLVLTLAHGLSETHTVHIAMTQFADEVAEKTDGRIQVKIFPNGQLGSENENLEQLQAGVIAMTKVSAPGLATYNDAFNTFGLPYIFNDTDDFYHVMDSQEMQDFFLSTGDDGFVTLTYYTSGARSFYTKDRAIRTPADLKGLKIRVPESQLYLDVWQALGATPVALALPELALALSGIGDMERLVGRIVYGTAGGRDVVALKNAMARLPHVKELLSAFDRGRLGELAQLDTLEDLTDLIGRTLCDDPPFSVREGEFIREGFDPEVDRLRGILHGGKGIIASMEAAEKEKTGIRTLKIGYNKVFGYYIEVSNSFKDQVPDTYIRKQTLVNGERYITQELKDLEHDILSASDRVSALEYELFTRLRQELSGHVARIQATAAAVAEADCLCSLAAVAVKNNYCCPVVDESGVIEIHQGRHPVVEAMRPDALFVPNDTYMGRSEDRVSIITGPNMAGKSTYMRQVALMVLMAQIGSFVPAKAARLGIVDRVFTRIGASDDLSAGQSTFMVEMTEVSDILHAATDKSLLILDEIGRGTSTFDGMSIARAVLEYCADPKRLGAKTLFATHYHELTAMEGTLPGVKNYNIAVRARGEEIVFLRKIVPGGADRSYGIEVAKLAGLPDAVVSRARKILRQLEEESGRPAAAPAPREDQVSFAAVAESQVVDRLRRTQVDSLTPLEALQLLYELKKKLT